MHFLITGHTGFKGSWLTLWLAQSGHRVSGISLDPAADSLFHRARVAEVLSNDFRLDIRDFISLGGAVAKINPDVVIHMAAQPLVRDSYREPRFTFETNAIGTLNVLESVSKCTGVKAQVIITTDKVYRNVGQTAGYTEGDSLGGIDPYSASKAMADILTQSWTSSFSSPPTAIARAGNVIGGGDASRERLVPDLIQACENGESPILRNPDAVRPWQHVLDCLNGYLYLVDYLIEDPSVETNAGAWNFGPGPENFVSVGDVASSVLQKWDADTSWQAQPSQEFHEASLLALDATKANKALGWRDFLTLDETLDWTVRWHKRVAAGEDPQVVTNQQIDDFQALG